MDKVTRRVDKQSKVTLPKDALEELKIKSGDLIEIKVEGSNLVLCKPNSNQDWTVLSELLRAVDDEIFAIVSTDSVLYVVEELEDLEVEDIKKYKFDHTIVEDDITIYTRSTDVTLIDKVHQLLKVVLETGITENKNSETR